MSIELQTDGAVAVVTLNRPDKKNAMLLAMRDSLADLCEQLNDRPEIRAVVLTGAGSDFCSGADIGEMGMGGLNGSFLRARHMHKVIRAVAHGPCGCSGRSAALSIPSTTRKSLAHIWMTPT